MKILNFVFVTILCVSVHIAGFSQEAPNLVKSGTFDEADVFGPTADWQYEIVEKPIVFQRERSDNAGYAYLNHNGGRATDPQISQKIGALSSGKSYLISGQYRGGNQSPIFCKPTDKKAFAIEVDGKVVAKLSLPNPLGEQGKWTPFSVVYEEHSFGDDYDESTLTFKGEIDGCDCDVAIDNITMHLYDATIPNATVTGTGSWHYGYGGVEAGSFTEFTEGNTFEELGGKIIKMSKNKDDEHGKWWCVSQNTTDKSVDGGHSIIYPPKGDGVMVLHPGKNQNERAKVKYTVSADGDYKVSVKWTLIDAQADKVKTEVFYKRDGNWTTADTKILQAAAKTHPFTQTVPLKKGDVILFEVENEGNYLDDSTMAELKVTRE